MAYRSEQRFKHFILVFNQTSAESCLDSEFSKEKKKGRVRSNFDFMWNYIVTYQDLSPFPLYIKFEHKRNWNVGKYLAHRYNASCNNFCAFYIFHMLIMSIKYVTLKWQFFRTSHPSSSHNIKYLKNDVVSRKNH